MAREMHVDCPKCGQVVEVPGETRRCPACGDRVSLTALEKLTTDDVVTADIVHGAVEKPRDGAYFSDETTATGGGRAIDHIDRCTAHMDAREAYRKRIRVSYAATLPLLSALDKYGLPCQMTKEQQRWWLALVGEMEAVVGARDLSVYRIEVADTAEARKRRSAIYQWMAGFRTRVSVLRTRASILATTVVGRNAA